MDGLGGVAYAKNNAYTGLSAEILSVGPGVAKVKGYCKNCTVCMGCTENTSSLSDLQTQLVTCQSPGTKLGIAGYSHLTPWPAVTGPAWGTIRAGSQTTRPGRSITFQYRA